MEITNLLSLVLQTRSLKSALMLFLCERQHEEERSRGIIKTTFWLMIHFSVKIGLNLYFFRVMIYRRSKWTQVNTLTIIVGMNFCEGWDSDGENLYIVWLGDSVIKKFCSQIQLIVLSKLVFLIKSASVGLSSFPTSNTCRKEITF